MKKTPEEDAIYNFLVLDKKYFRKPNPDENPGQHYKTKGTPVLGDPLLKRLVPEAIELYFILDRPTTTLQVKELIENFFESAKTPIKY
ncbi:hypothetical protein A9Q91_04840 [Candidatus Gracilibacteria bacterium 28_42_T64]|nr:hypothetical protein A9Q91_04840 [Candidatus Gracilibacteria bacterium 28_42_T64]